MAARGGEQPSFAEGINAAMADLASAMAAPDADIHFASEVMKLMATYLQSKRQPNVVQGPGGGAAAGGPAAGGQPPTGSAGPGNIPGGPAGGSPTNPSQPDLSAPAGPMPGGPTPGLTPNPDELRRTLQEVSGQ